MPAELALTDAPHVLWRVERADPPLRFAQLNPVDALNDRAGNRFDVPGAGVLYAASVAEGAFAETLAQFRPTASVAAALAEAVPEPGRVLPGQVPRAWLQSRRLRSLELPGALPFVDVEAPQTHTYLTQHAPEVVTRNGLLNLDVATVRGPSRRLTRDLAAWIYSRTDETGHPLYGGIRYVSRLGDFECWAIFDGTDAELRSNSLIQPEGHAFAQVCYLYGISVQP